MVKKDFFIWQFATKYITNSHTERHGYTDALYAALLTNILGYICMCKKVCGEICFCRAFKGAILVVLLTF